MFERFPRMVDALYNKIVSVGGRMSIALTTYAAFIPNMQADAAAGVDRWLREQLGRGWLGSAEANILIFYDGPVAQPDRAAVS